MVGFDEKLFKAKSSEMAGKRYVDMGFCKYSKYFLYNLLTVKKHYTALHSPKLIYF